MHGGTGAGALRLGAAWRPSRCPPTPRVADRTSAQPRPGARAAGAGPGLRPGALRADRENKHHRAISVARTFRARCLRRRAGALTTPAPFRERLVWFWANHFTVSIRRGSAPPDRRLRRRGHPPARHRPLRRHAARRDSPSGDADLPGQCRLGRAPQPGRPAPQRGLNENLARECMELHTVCPAAGYTQADVTNFARILTGWSVDFNADPPGFRFRPAAHEPGRRR